VTAEHNVHIFFWAQSRDAPQSLGASRSVVYLWWFEELPKRDRSCKDDCPRILMKRRREFSDGHERLVGRIVEFSMFQMISLRASAAGAAMTSQSALSDVPKLID
jgi:hypothetical protein